MKKRISDLMSGYPVEPLELDTDTPLSSQRIKELTMKKISQEKPKKSHLSIHRVLIKFAAAAAILSTLTVTAAAAEKVFGVSDWFRSIVKSQAQADRQIVQEENLDVTLREIPHESQLQTLDSLGRTPGEAVTSEGTTMTLQALYSDEYSMHLYFQVEGPEGSVLPDGIQYTIYAHGDGYPMDIAGDKVVANMTMETEALPDSDPTDNKKDFHVTIYSTFFGTRTERNAALNDGVSKKLRISGLYEQVVDMNGDEDGYRRVVPGSFAFDITNNPATIQRTKVNVLGAAYGGHTIRQWTHEGIEHTPHCVPESEKAAHEGDYSCAFYDENGLHTQENDYTVKPVSLDIGPLSAQWECNYTSADPLMSYGLQFKLIMKDGTSPLAVDKGGLSGDGHAAGVQFFTNPIDLTEIDHIEVGDPEVGPVHNIPWNP